MERKKPSVIADEIRYIGVLLFFFQSGCEGDFALNAVALIARIKTSMICVWITHPLFIASWCVNSVHKPDSQFRFRFKGPASLFISLNPALHLYSTFAYGLLVQTAFPLQISQKC